MISSYEQEDAYLNYFSMNIYECIPIMDIQRASPYDGFWGDRTSCATF